MSENLHHLKLPYKANWHRIWWQLAIFIAASVGAVFAGLQTDERMSMFFPEGKILASTYNKKASGLSALWELCNTLNFQCDRWQSAYRQLSTIQGTLVIIDPSKPMGDFEIEQILDWVSKGNNLVYMDDFNYRSERRFLKSIKLHSDVGVANRTYQMIPPDSANPVFAFVRALKVNPSRRIQGGNELLGDDVGSFLTEVNHGRGHVLVGTLPDFCSNQLIQDNRNWGEFQFLINYLRTMGGGVWFDEHCHGYSDNRNVLIFLARGIGGLIVVQLSSILLIAVFSTSQRFGATKTVNNERQISSTASIIGLANTYRHAHANIAVLEIIGQKFRQELCQTLAISPHESTERMISDVQYGDTFEKNKGNIIALLKQYDKILSTKQISDKELREFVASCDKITFDKTSELKS
jgi:hypothetical protein